MTSIILQCFGQALRQLRKAIDLTQEELAFEAGLQRNYISSLELGHKQPTLVTIFKLSQALKVAPGQLLDPVYIQIHERNLLEKKV